MPSTVLYELTPRPLLQGGRLWNPFFPSRLSQAKRHGDLALQETTAAQVELERRRSLPESGKDPFADSEIGMVHVAVLRRS